MSSIPPVSRIISSITSMRERGRQAESSRSTSAHTNTHNLREDTTMPDGGGGKPQLLPFRRNTRQRFRQTGVTQSVAGGGSALSATANFQLDRVGLLNYLIVMVRATVTLSGAGALATLGPWSVIDRVRVDLNLGNMNLVDITGFQLYQINKLLFRGWSPDGLGNLFTVNATTFAVPVAMGANTWIIPLIIPISANPGSQFDTGLLSLQAPEIQ